MGRNLVESIMGAVVLIVAGLFLLFAYSQADLRPVSGYQVSAAFNSVGGLPVGSDVTINGIKVGTVVAEELDPNTYMAVVRMAMRSEVQLPLDTVASVASEGLLGGKYIRLEPGKAAERIAPGGTIRQVKDYKSIEEMVGEIIFTATGGGK